MALQRPVAVVLLASLVTGCMQWKSVDLSGPGIAPEDVTTEVRITRADGDTIVLRDAAMRADTISGVEPSGAPASVPLSDVHAFESRRISPLVLLMPAIIVGFIVVPRVLNHTVRNTPTPIGAAGS